MTTQNPTLAEVLDAAIDHRLRESFGGWLPGRIESYDSATNRATVQILILDEYFDEEGERQTEPFPPLQDIPVGWPCIGGKFGFRIDLAKGDECIVMFAARPTSKFVKTGGLVDPEDDRHHDINDAFILPCRLSFGGADASPQIHVTASTVEIGGNKNLVTRAEFLDHGHAVVASLGTPTTPQRIVGDALATPAIPPLATGVTGFPGTQKLKGG